MIQSAAAVEPQQCGAGRCGAVEQLILVDEHDHVVGAGDKLSIHERGELHRAFSVFVFNAAGELLLQRRAAVKYHFANLWSNTCCGHPRPDEATADAAARRLCEEFGFRAPLAERVETTYRAEDPVSGLIEHEYLHIFRGAYNGIPDPDPAEIGAWRWIAPQTLLRAMQMHPDWFTPWFRLLIERGLLSLRD